MLRKRTDSVCRLQTISIGQVSETVTTKLSSVAYFFHLSLSTCVSRCPPRSFANQGGVCWACHESCETCGGAGQDSCLTCAPAHLYVIDLAVCLQTCPDGYFESKSRGVFNCYDKWWWLSCAKIVGGITFRSASTLSHLSIIFPCHQLERRKRYG